VGLDIYVGSLTRYYAREWESIAQQAAREMGVEFQVIRQHDPPDAISDPEQIRPAVFAWREALSQGLGENLPTALDWDEGPASPYFTDKPTWDCYADLILWAAYDEQRHLSRPEQHVDDWSKDPAYRLSIVDVGKGLYSQLYEITWWLPGDFEFVFKADDVGGNEIWFGSSSGLLRQLRNLNHRTWQAEPGFIRQWRRDLGEHGARLGEGAKFAFAVLYELAAAAVEHQLPMLMDW
jgi:hypothetical protein